MGSIRATHLDVARALGSFSARLRFVELPETAVRRAKQVVLDTLGTALRGCQTDFGQRIAAFSRRTWPGTDATLIGTGRCLSAEGAAFANASMLKVVEMDDSHREYGHVAAQVVPAALAAAEAKKRNGTTFIVALVAGYEVFGRVGRQVRQALIRRGFDHKGVVGALASAAAAGVVFSLDEDQMTHALALATSLASGLETYTYDPSRTHTKDLIAGFGARNGVFAALLAEDGFRAPRGAIDGPNGYVQGFGDQFDAECALRGLGASFEIETIGFKPHGGCRHVHPGVDAAIEIRRRLTADPAQITRIDIGIYEHAISAPFRVTLDPENSSAAEYSLPIATVIGLLYGSFYPEDIERFNDPQVKALARKVHAYVDQEIQARYPHQNGCVVRVTLEDGGTVEERVKHAKGEPEHMLTEAEFVAKFLALAKDVIPPRQLDELMACVWTLEETEDVGVLARLMVPHVPRTGRSRSGLDSSGGRL